jgi:acetyl/propionyl-CoA carboxylase alpha subunit
VIPGAQRVDTPREAQAAAAVLGYPVLLKAAGGGGGKGMRRVDSAAALPDAFDAAKREAGAAFNDDRLLLERYIHPARHIEVQVLGDGRDAVALGERECSLQRRYQKIIEEAPSVAMNSRLREALQTSATALMRATGYAGAATVEFLLGPDGDFYFLEVNTRLQVEHPVTELLTGIDIVAAQMQIALGGGLPTPAEPRGHAIEARLNAEDPYRDFLPSVGPVLMLEWPEHPHVRIDSGITTGSVVTPHYDSLLAKIIAWGPDREVARRRLVVALEEMTLLGVQTNQRFLIQVLNSEFFEGGQTFTTTIESQKWSAPPLPDYVLKAGDEALAGGTASARGSGSGGGGQDVDVFSPWHQLGAFRLGQ